MAIYRLEKKSISRGNNHNLVAAVAYRAGAELTDTNPLNPKATTHDYTKKTDVAHSEIVLPDELAKQLTKAGVTLNLEQIANLVEQGETTKRGKMKLTAKLASEYVLAGSHELSQAENIRAFKAFAKQQAEEQGVVTMVFVHDPKHGKDMSAGEQAGDSSKSKDLRNIHAHIVVLSRQLQLIGDQLLLGDKSDSELSNTDRSKKGLPPSRQWLKGVREQWADIQNQSLQSHNLAPVTHKSYKDLGLKFKPTHHLGKNASTMARMGVPTYLEEHNESINRYNQGHLEFATSRLTSATEQILDRSQQWTESINRGLNTVKRGFVQSKRRIEGGKQDVAWTVAANEDINKLISANSKNTEWANKRAERLYTVISASEHQAKDLAEQERRTDNVIAARARRATPRPNPFDDRARRERLAKIDEQEERFDSRERQFNTDTNRNRYADERAAAAAGLLKIGWAMALLGRHHENNALQIALGETSEEYPRKFDERQISLLNKFSQTIGADGKITDFRSDSRRVAEFFTGAVVEQYKDIIQILRNPEAERDHCDNIISSRAHSDALQSSLNHSTESNTSNTLKVSNKANESVSTLIRKYRP